MTLNLRGASPLSDNMFDSVSDRSRLEKALVTKTPTRNLTFGNKNAVKKNYSDKNGNDVTKVVQKDRKPMAFWTLVCLLFLLALGNLALISTVLAILRLSREMESMEFLPEHNAIKFRGDIDLDNVYKRDGLIESFGDLPMKIESDDGSVNFNLQSRLSRLESKLVVNKSGVYVRGVSSMEMVDPDSGEVAFTTTTPEINVPDGVNNLHAKIVSTKRITSPIDEDLSVRSDTSIHFRGAEGTHMESKELFWSADQDIYLKSINGSIILSGKEGVYVDVKYLPIAVPNNRSDVRTQSTEIGHYKVCVCMPQGKLFRIPVLSGQRVTCSHINMTGELNPCV